MSLYIVNHPVIEHKISILRNKETKTSEFRKTVQEIGSLMTYEMTRSLKLKEVPIQTPIQEMNAKFLDGKNMVVVPILRAGLGMVDGITNLIPTAKVGHIGLYRDEKTLEAIEYFAKFPNELDKRSVFLVDPMLATGATAVAAINILKRNNAKDIKLVCLVGCPEGVKIVQDQHPDVDIYLAALDEKLNEKGYIQPGLGDAGDRLFGTK
ncbi:MAG: uracil phosphoribosyltransferase [Mycoplasmatales bacterium]